MEQAISTYMSALKEDEHVESWIYYDFAHLTYLQWLTGNPDLAADNARRVLKETEHYESPFDFTNFLFLTNIVYRNVGDLVAVKANAEQMLSIGTKYDLPLSQQSGDIFSGWLLAHQDNILEGIEQTTRGIEGFRRMGHSMYQTHRLAMLVEMHLMAGQIDEAQTVLDDAFTISGEKDEHFWDVELHRLQGDILLAGEATVEAEVSYYEAVEIARQQGAKSLELRVQMALGRLWQSQGKHAQAYQHLSELYNCFTEGFDTHDLQTAKALLDQLG
jgi:predicted ATPase